MYPTKNLARTTLPTIQCGSIPPNPLEDMMYWATLQQLGWRFMQEVANKFNCFGGFFCSAPKKAYD